jgi:hypothetical protein
VVLGQSLQPADWLAITAIVTANALALSTRARVRTGSGSGNARASGHTLQDEMRR